MVRTVVSAGELSISCARLLAGWVIALWLSCPLPVSQHSQLSFPSLRGWLMSNNPCCSGLRRQTAEGVVRCGLRPSQWVLQAARVTSHCRLKANGTEMSAAHERCGLWESLLAIGDFAFAWLVFSRFSRVPRGIMKNFLILLARDVWSPSILSPNQHCARTEGTAAEVAPFQV